MNFSFPLEGTKSFDHHLSIQEYKALYRYALHHPKAFWAQQATQFLDFFQPWNTIMSGQFHDGNIRWFDGAQLNVCYHCLDRHLANRQNQIAIIWQGDDPNSSYQLKFIELYDQVCRLANVLKKRKVNKGDRVCIYMPMIPETVVAMLACTRIGAIHVVVCATLSSKLLENCLLDATCKIVITADQMCLGGKIVPIKKNVDMARQHCPFLQTVIVVRRVGKRINWFPEQDIWYHQALHQVSNDCPLEMIEANHILFILYKMEDVKYPKGIVYRAAGYLLYVAMTYYYLLSYDQSEVCWCYTDISSILGHSYVVYGPLVNGATIVMFEDVVNELTPTRFWQVINRYHVTTFYTVSSTIHHLMYSNPYHQPPIGHHRLRLLASMGNTLDQQTWDWCYHIVGDKNGYVLDTWLQPETGGILISSLPGLKPGLLKPFLGIQPILLDDRGQLLMSSNHGELAIARAWPGMMQGLYQNQQRYMDYFNDPYPGYYYTRNIAYLHDDRCYQMGSSVYDFVKIIGTNMNTLDIENILKKNSDMTQIAVVAVSYPNKGQYLYIFVCIGHHVVATNKLKTALLSILKQETGDLLQLGGIYFVPDLPKNRSGRIARHILGYMITHEIDKIGDTSILANPKIVDTLIKLLS